MFVASVCCFFFFEQQTAYEMRISDWISDVCFSDLTVQLCKSPMKLCCPSSAAKLNAPIGIMPVRILYAVRLTRSGPKAASSNASTALSLCVERAVKIGRASCRERVCQYV